MHSSASLAAPPTLDEVREERARRSLDAFALRMLGLEPARHHRYVNSYLEAVVRGEISRLILLEPPGHGKSTYASILFPAWVLGKFPHLSVIAASHTSQFAARFGRKVRNLLMLPEYPFEGVALAGDSKAADQWETNGGGEYFAVGVGGAVTGRRADLAIIDDPIKGRHDADSITVRENLWEWYRSDLHTRLKPGGSIILIQTRWHEDDLAGHLLAEMEVGGEQWEVVSLPALAEQSDPLGRTLGEPLWPEWYDLKMLEVERTVQGPRNWAALYQQRPAPEEGDFFKREWLRWYTDQPKHVRIYGASDYAVTAAGGDYTVHGVIGVDPDDNIYVLDWWREQAASDVWIEVFLDMAKKWSPAAWAEETGQIIKSVGPFIDKRMRETNNYFYRTQFTSAMDKPTRAQAFRARMAMGKVYFPKNAPWIDVLVNELLHFPSGRNDDQVDVLSLFGRMLSGMDKGHLPPEPPKPCKPTYDDVLEDYDRRQSMRPNRL